MNKSNKTTIVSSVILFLIISVPNVYSDTFNEETCLSLISIDKVKEITKFDGALEINVINSNLETLNEGTVNGCVIAFQNEDTSFSLSLGISVAESEEIAQSMYGDIFSASHRMGYEVIEGNNGPWIHHLVEVNEMGIGSVLGSIKDDVLVGLNSPQTDIPIESSAMLEILKIVQSNIDEPKSANENTIKSEEGSNENTPSGGGCLIATATYGSELAPQVQQLRELRDNSLLQTESGTSFMITFNDVYYSFSPMIADYERENPVFKELVKLTITPMISSLSILNHVDMDSESSVLGYGISLIALNLAMYVGIPVVAIVGIRKSI